MRKKQYIRTLLWGLTLLLMAGYFAAMCWLHHQQLCAVDGFAADLSAHLETAEAGQGYSLTSLLIAPIHTLVGAWGVAVLVAAFHLAALAVFAWGMKTAVPQLPVQVRLLISLVVNLSQAVWIPRGGYWYLGTVNGTIYHNTTYIMLAPFAMLAMLTFPRVWAGLHTNLEGRAWLSFTLWLTLATSFKASFVFAFAPVLLILLAVDLVQTRGRNLRREILVGCSVLPSIVLCLIQSAVLFGGEGEGLQLVFLMDPACLASQEISWGLFSEASRRGLLRSFVFVGTVALLLGRTAWGSFRYRFSFCTFAMAMAQALLIVEKGQRMGHGNLWWGPFICYWIFFLESFCALLRGWKNWRCGRRGGWLGGRLAICSGALLWHILSGICFLVLLMQGNSYNIPIATWKFWF